MATTLSPVQERPIPVKARQNWLLSLRHSYLLRKLLRTLFTVFVVTTITFFLIRLLPGNPIEIYVNQLVVTHNAYFSGVGSGSGAVGSVESPGMYFDLNVSTESVGDVNLSELMQAAGTGGDAEAQKEALGTIALAYNELLPQIPLWERYGNNPVPSRFATGWLPEDDPI